ncbi:uncharacterized protein [Malus domestica]|uniref:uncharacterized protein n=1 Tax=Malus domestica TaxID=3750 RepID=UPI0039770620
MAKEHVRGCNWTFDEDIALCLAWISVSEDGVVGTNQNRKDLWGKIVDKFHENSNAGRREAGGVYDRWKIINKACTLWKGSLERAMVDMPSGRGVSEIGDKAMAIYKIRTTPKNQAFKLHHAWNILKDCPRWGINANQQCGRLFHNEAPPPNDVNKGVNFADNEGVNQMSPTSSLPRPSGRDKQKEAKRKGKSQDPIREQFASEMARMNENQCRRQEESAQMFLAMKHKGDREQERYETNLIMADLDKYTPERKRYLSGKQKEILRRNATRSIFQDDDSSQDYHPSPPPSQDGGYHY